MLSLALSLLGVVILLCFGAVTLRYRTVWHPLLMPLGSLFVMVVGAPLAQQLILGERTYPQFQIQSALLTSLYVLTLSFPFLTRWDPLGPPLRRLLAPLDVPRRPELLGGYHFISLTLLLLGLLGYLLLISSSPAGWNWILHSRTAYQSGRAGVGHWYVLSQGAVFLAYLIWLYYCRVRSWKIFIPTTLLVASSFILFGSKQGIIGILIAACLYAHYYIRPMGLRTILIAGCCLIPLVVLSPWLQGNFNTLKQSLTYYDYFDNSARYLQEQPKIGLQLGWAFGSSLWEYVPRAVYPAKPFIFGQLIINDMLWPGAAENGHTPALLPWVVFHLDFGLLGVLFGGLVSGYLLRGIYSAFLETKSFLSFLIFLQICFTPVLKHTPLLYFAIAIFLLSLLLKAATRAFLILQNSRADTPAPSVPMPRNSPA